MVALPRRPFLLAVAALLLLAGGSALAQSGTPALVAPGDVVPPKLLEAKGGPAGRAMASVIGRRPIFVIYWRPGDPVAEQALVEGVETASLVAPEAVLMPVAFLASRQSPSEIDARLEALGITGVSSYQDGGQLGRAFGLRRLPAFMLIDAGGVLRLVGGASVSQTASGGVSIAEALAKAGRGQPVPTLGVLSSMPIYKMLGEPLPAVVVRGLDGRSRSLRDLIPEGKRALIFYWLPTCGHCKAALPELRRWYEAAKPDDLVIVDIAQTPSGSMREEATRIIADYPWVHALDVDRSAGRALRVRDTPSLFLIAPGGEIAGIRVGGKVDWESWLGG
jgi:thiol-disulfide isomerase/thioredoxin